MSEPPGSSALAPDPLDIFERAQREGRRRLDMPLIELASTGFIAGGTIIFGIVALGVVEARIEPDLGQGAASIAGALAFGIGVVFLVVGRSELFSENFFDPVAAVIDDLSATELGRLVRLWAIILVWNLVSGALLVALLTVDGALPDGSTDALVRVAEEIARNSWSATLVRAILAGSLMTLLSYMLSAVDGVGARIAVAYMVGFFLALGPFDHVIVSALHLLFGVWLGGGVGYDDVASNLGLSVVGNMLGGLLLVTLTHTAQVKGARR